MQLVETGYGNQQQLNQTAPLKETFYVAALLTNILGRVTGIDEAG